MQAKPWSQKADFTHAQITRDARKSYSDEDRSADNNDEQTTYFERGE
jgi:hypothetical protein